MGRRRSGDSNAQPDTEVTASVPPATPDEMQRLLDAAEHFPDHNPNPVLRIDADGALSYHNAASQPLVAALRLEVGAVLPARVLEPIRQALDDDDETAPEVEIAVDGRTYSLKPVVSPEWGFVNVYATDVTAARAIERFPEANPEPVLRIAVDGELRYANRASEPLMDALRLTVGAPLGSELWERVRTAAAADAVEPVEVQGHGRWYELTCVPIEEFGFINVYGRDTTATKAIQRFPNRNPNPVMRLAQDGRLLFANPASDPIVQRLGLEVGSIVPDDLRARIDAEIERGNGGFEVEAGESTYLLVVTSVFEFGFINVYGTDVTAAKQLEASHRENERLLLNILPAPIAERLRRGESVIADRHEDLSLLFADIVGFTEMSSGLPPDEVVDMLDDLFRHLDQLVEDYRLEKIKTIGDAYMIVGGLPPDEDDHLERVASMALDLNESLRTRPNAVEMRVGLHAGPAVAGVIGAKKFIYDVWGATVNTASRLESNGLPGRIQVTDATRSRLEDRFIFDDRGTVDLKGMGPTHTWFIRDRKSSKGSIARTA